MKTLKFARIAAATIALAVGGAHAALITSWDVTDVAGFDPLTINPTGLAVDGYPALSNGGLSLFWGNAATASGQSGLQIANQPTQTTTLGVPVTTVSVTHQNWPIYAPALTSVDIFATIILNPTGWANPPPPDVVNGGITFKIKFIETPNLGSGATCADGSIAAGNGCPDIFVINNVPADFSFIMPDWDMSGEFFKYDVSFIGTGFTALSAGACAAAGASAGCLGFETPENAATTAYFQVRIDGSRAVPEPGSLALLGLGLLGLGAARRRKSAK